MVDKGFAFVAGACNARVDRKLAQKRYLEICRHALAAAGAEDLGDGLTVGADKPAHVFHNPDDGKLELCAEIEGFADIGGGDLLRSRDHERMAAFRQQLDDRERFVTCSRGAIDNQVIERTPFDVSQKLFDHAGFHRPPPDQRIILGFKKQADGDNMHACNGKWQEFLAD